MRSLFLTAIYVSFLFYGLRAPYVFVLGYLWVDISTPQYVAWGILNSIPVSLIMGVAVALSFFYMKKPAGKWFSRETVLMFIFAVWMTASLIWAEVPVHAYNKWDWAIKSILLACFIPVFLRTKNQVDSFVWVFVLSVMMHCIPYAGKVLISGGGYRANYSLVGGNTGFSEGSTLSLISVVVIPLCVYLYKNDKIFFRYRLVKLILIGFVFSALITSLGTFARTGLVSLAALSVFFLLLAKRRLVYLALFPVVGYVLISFMGADWMARMETINDSGELSAMGRVAVWKWTVEYVLAHPWGGGFDAYRINVVELPLENGGVLIAGARAFHSIYFEILGELGFPGFFVYSFMVVTAVRSCLRLRKAMLAPEYLWVKELASMLLASIFVYLVGGAFIGIAYQSAMYYLIVIVSSLVLIFNSANKSHASQSN